MNSYIVRLLFLTFGLNFSISAWSHDLNGEWILNIENLNHQPITQFNIKFTDQSGSSCLAGNWLRVDVLSSTTKDKNFFPISEPLSYSVEKNRITIGRNEICDGFLLLSGLIKTKITRGKYYSLGVGGTYPHGFFSLSRKN